MFVMGAGDNKTLPERLRRFGSHANDCNAVGCEVCEQAAVALEAAEKAQRVRDAVLAGRDDRIAELEVRVEAAEAERDETRRVLRETGDKWAHEAHLNAVQRERAEAAEARLVAIEAERDEALAALKDEMQWDMGGVPENEWMRRAIAAEARVAENAELKGLKAGGDRPEAVAVAEKLQALAVAAHDFVIQANIYIPPATTRLMGTRRELVSLVDAVLNPAPAAAVRPQTDTPDQAAEHLK